MPAPPFDASDATGVTLPDGRRVVSFGGCNYLGLANHREALDAVREGLERFGVSSSASRETTGNAAPHETLERDLAAFLGSPAALLMPDGYVANIAACQALRALGVRRACIDARSHRSLWDAAATAGFDLEPFAHADAGRLAEGLTRAPSPAVVLTDGVFTADGEPAPVRSLVQALRDGDWLLVDDCHGLGVVGRGGRGTAAFVGAGDERIVVTSSLAKGLGGAGGIIAGSAAMIGACQATSAYVCTTPIAPALAMGTRAALTVLAREPERVARLGARAAQLRSGLTSLGLLSGAARTWTTPIAAFSRGEPEEMGRVAAHLLDDGWRVSLQKYPGGPQPLYFRLSVNSEHTESQIDGLLTSLGKCLSGASPEVLHSLS